MKIAVEVRIWSQKYQKNGKRRIKGYCPEKSREGAACY